MLSVLVPEQGKHSPCLLEFLLSLVERVGVGWRFVVTAIASVEVSHRNRRELFGREVERRHVDGVERTAERLELAARERTNSAGSAKGERQVRL